MIHRVAPFRFVWLVAGTALPAPCQTPADCDDGSPCTDDDCVALVCQKVPNAAPCDDGLFCTAADGCIDGACVGQGDPCGGDTRPPSPWRS